MEIMLSRVPLNFDAALIKIDALTGNKELS